MAVNTTMHDQPTSGGGCLWCKAKGVFFIV